MEQTPKIRKTQLTLIFGVNGAGKTTFIKEKIIPCRKKSLVVTPYFSEWTELPIVSTPEEIYNMQGAARLIYKSPADFDNIRKSFYGGNLILDDARRYLYRQSDENLSHIYVCRRQFGLDVYIVSHGPRRIPPEAFTYASFIVLFSCPENFSLRQKDMNEDSFKKLLQYQKEIKAMNSKGDKYCYKILKVDDTI